MPKRRERGSGQNCDTRFLGNNDKSKGCRQKIKQYICRHCPNKREGGQPHFKKIKRNNFLTKVGEGGCHKSYCQK